ncbi:MAG: tetratricopeptide repeat protein [Lysobacterales bacterium]|jgi:TolB-like protein
MAGLFNELKRRNVFRVGVAYIIVSWVILQFVDIIKDILTFPTWFPQMVLVLLGIGFPIALIISWAFEMTPQGLVKTAEVDKDRSITPKTGRKINKLIIGGLSLAVIFLLVDRFYIVGERPGGIIPEAEAGQTSIAVLPFVNMSGDTKQEFFSDGMTEEILNVLAKNHALRVAGRTSSFAYKGKNEDLRTIGKELGVDYLIEGSVRKDADTVRITAQLVQAKDGFHVWSETYDRKLTDIFVVQDEISRAIADALQVSFGGQASTPNKANQTDNMAAYDLYLKAREAHKGRHIPEALDLARKVTDMEPDFAPGWAVYAQALALAPNWIYEDEPMQSAAAFARAYIAAQKALILDPNSVEALGALANVYRTRLQWHEAGEAYEKALSIDADNPVILEDYVEFLQAVGKVRAALPLAQKLVALEPRVPIYLHAMLNAYWAIGDFSAALPFAKKQADLGPDLFFMVGEYAQILWLTGQKQQAREVFAKAENVPANYRALTETWFDAREKGLEGLKPEQVKIAMNDPTVLCVLNQKDKFFALLSKMIKLGWWGDFFTFFPETGPYRKLPEFKTLMRELKLVDYWRKDGWGDYCKPLGKDDFACH